MGDTWGDEAPPEQAYSRVTRDLVAVTAGFADYLDSLPAQLESSFDCRVRPATPDEVTQLDPSSRGLETSAVEAADPDCAVLLIGRTTYAGGAQATIAFGRAVHETVPHCFCDACDEDAESMIEQTQTLVAATVGGVHEFRRTYEAPDNAAEEALYDPPWLEHGIESDALTTSRAGHGLEGEEFSVHWKPWPT